MKVCTVPGNIKRGEVPVVKEDVGFPNPVGRNSDIFDAAVIRRVPLQILIPPILRTNRMSSLYAALNI